MEGGQENYFFILTSSLTSLDNTVVNLVIAVTEVFCSAHRWNASKLTTVTGVSEERLSKIKKMVNKPYKFTFLSKAICYFSCYSLPLKQDKPQLCCISGPSTSP
ncbi:hypothetical protein GRJ2_001099000 [Grus japonensis]|uniref:Uncharacterized protein n=1 Tax=Grus japonensis TaxID=30415 RepID=A0ABC9WPH7_GRUJA